MGLENIPEVQLELVPNSNFVLIKGPANKYYINTNFILKYNLPLRKLLLIFILLHHPSHNFTPL